MTSASAAARAERVTGVGDLENADALESRFEASSGAPQLIALVSPTCEVCLDGVAMVLRGLDDPAGRAFEAHIVWTPVLDGDTGALAADVSRARVRTGVTHYWDHAKVISAAAYPVLDLAAWDRTVAWDVYLLYRRGARWTSPFPSPTAWLHQLRIEDQPTLEAGALRGAMQAVTSRDPTTKG